MSTPSQQLEKTWREQRIQWQIRFDQLAHIEGGTYAGLDRLFQEIQSAHASQTAELERKLTESKASANLILSRVANEMEPDDNEGAPQVDSLLVDIYAWSQNIVNL